jgi:methyltransferase family protein
MLRWIEKLPIRTCLDVGCAQPFLIEEIRKKGVRVWGCDLSPSVIQTNIRHLPDVEFRVLDVSRESWDGRRFDLVIASEVLEHIDAWSDALDHLVAMSDRYILITVPSGPVRWIDRHVGHHRHFAGSELIDALQKRGCVIQHSRRWGFPFHSLYKWLINRGDPERLYKSFAGGQAYSPWQKALSAILYGLFYVNDIFPLGQQLLVLVERPMCTTSR